MPMLDHVGVKITDPERSVQFYRDVFGFDVVDRRVIGANVETIGLKVGDQLLFLLYREDYQSRDPHALAGTDHVAISFDGASWEQIVGRVRQMGVPIVRENESVLGATGRGPCVYVLDPDGHEIEIKHA